MRRLGEIVSTWLGGLREDATVLARVPEIPRDRQAVMDFLPYDVALADGVIGLSAHGLLAGLDLVGPDLASTEPEDLVALDQQVDRAFEALGPRWAIHHETLREVDLAALDSDDEPADAWGRAVAERRRRTVERVPRYATRTSLYVSYYPRDGAGFLAPGEHLERVERVMTELTRGLGRGLRVRRMSTEDLLGRLHGLVDHGRDRWVREVPCFVDQLLAAEAMEVSDTWMRVGERFIVPVGLVGVRGMEYEPGVYEALARLPGRFRFVVRLLPLARESASRAIEGQRRDWGLTSLRIAQLLGGLIGAVRSSDPSPTTSTSGFAEQMQAECDDAMARLLGGERHVLLTGTAFAYGTSAETAQRQAGELRELLREAGFVAAVDRFNVLEAWHGALPGITTSNIRRFQVESSDAVGLLPKGSVDAGTPRCPHPRFAHLGPLARVLTRQGERYDLNLHLRDVGHTVVFGPTGAGKSVLVNLLLHGVRTYRDARVLGLDVDFSQMAHTWAAEGEHVELAKVDGEGSGPRLAPLARLDGTPESVTAVLDFVLELLHQQGLDVGPIELGLVMRALQELTRLGPEHRSLSTLAAKVASHEVRAHLAPYLESGAYGELLDGKASQRRADERFRVVELRRVLSMPRAVSAPTLVHLFGELSSLFGRDRLTCLSIEEGHTALGHSLFARKLEDALLTVRKRNGFVVFVLHSPAEMLDSPLWSALVGSCQRRIFLPDAEAGSNDAVREGYRQLGLGTREIDGIARAEAKRHYYVSSSEGSQWVDLVLSDLELAIFGAAGDGTAARLRELRAEHGAGWLEAWLTEQGVARSEIELYRRHATRPEQ